MVKNEHNKIAIAYHDGCMDGIAGAAVLYIGIGANDVEFIPMSYGKEELVEGEWRQVFFVDYCPEKETHDHYASRSDDMVVVMDHHKTREELVLSYEGGIFSRERSGAGMALDYIREQSTYEDTEDLDLLVRYVEDRDLWKWKMPNSDAVNEGLSFLYRGYSPLELACDLLDGIDVNHLLDIGDVIVEKRNEDVSSALKDAITCEIGGHKARICNSRSHQSHLGEALACEFGVGVVWWLDGDLNVRLSIRGDGTIDVSDIALLYGGGGHKNAAGARISLEQLQQILTEGK